MKRRSSGIPLSKAAFGFEQYKTAEGLSPNTFVNYRDHLELFVDFTGDASVEDISSRDIVAFIAWLRKEYKPRRLTGGTQPLSPKTIRNIYATLSSLFTWACFEFEIPNPVKGIPAPRFQRAPVTPFSKNDLEALLKACKFFREADTFYCRGFTVSRPTTRRDQVIILTLLDTGLGASEL
jgi:integrase/recombinase XerD